MLEIKELTARSDDGNDILKGINLTVRPGEVHAIMGPNGSGKSTLVNLLLRLYEPDSGEILLDGVNIKEYNIKRVNKYYLY